MRGFAFHCIERSSWTIGVHPLHPSLRLHRIDPYRCLPVVLWVRGLPRHTQAQARGLLRLLLLRHCAVPTNPGAWQR